MKLSVIIHNFNRASVLEHCLVSITEQVYRPIEVIILDAGSTDGSQRLIDKFSGRMRANNIEVKEVRTRPMGVAASRNYGAQFAGGEVLCFIDNDASFVTANELKRIARLFNKHHHLGVVSFRVLKGDTDEIDPFAWVFRRSLKAWSGRSFQTFTFAGTGFAIRTKAFKDMGGFWGHLKYSREEEELSLALIWRGWEIFYYPPVSIRHYFDSRGRMNITERRYVELKNGILIFWRRLPMPFAVVTIIARIFSITGRTMLVEKRNPNAILSAIIHAAREWRTYKLIRKPVSSRAFWKYVYLHFQKQFVADL